MTFRNHLLVCNKYNIDHFRPFVVIGIPVGWVTHRLAHHLSRFSNVFTITKRAVFLNRSLSTIEDRTSAVAKILFILSQNNYVPPLLGEMFSVVYHFGGSELLQVDRSAVPLFGVRAFGIHVNGFVKASTSDLHLWIGRRSLNKTVAPGKLDNLVAGGQLASLSLIENLVKECAEEANIPRTLAETARSVGVVTYCMENDYGLKFDCMFCFDLNLPEDFVPKNTDGAIESFTLMPIDEVIEKVQTTNEFKFNVNLVILDFIIRHGFVTPGKEPHYLHVFLSLRNSMKLLLSHFPHTYSSLAS